MYFFSQVKANGLLDSSSNFPLLITEKQIYVEEKTKAITRPKISQCID